MKKHNIESEIASLHFKVLETIELDKSLGIGNRLNKLNVLKEALENYDAK